MNFVIREHVELAPLTTLQIGGAARFFARATSENDIAEAVSFAATNALPLFILGGGSNVLIADTGFDGLVLQIAVKGVSIRREKDEIVVVTAGAGEDWDELVEVCVRENLQGFECLSGIPGFVGGTPVQNVGAYGQEISETVVSVRCFDRKKKRFVDLLNHDCRFAYRTSIFNTTERNRFIVASVTFALRKNAAPKISYKDLQNYFAHQSPTLREAREAVLKIRRAKSMVIDAQDPNSRSAGSFFKNPVVDSASFAEIESKARTLEIIGANETVPKFAVDENSVKIPAAWLIEKSGFYKGYKAGKAGISTNHTLAIVNAQNAQAIDVIALKAEIQKKVKEKFAVDLQPEPIFVGFDKL